MFCAVISETALDAPHDGLERFAVSLHRAFGAASSRAGVV